MLSKISVFAFFFIHLNHLISGKFVGDKCVPNKHIAEGKCALFSNCEAAQRQVKIKKGHDFERCGFDNLEEILCCPLTTDIRLGISTTERSTIPKRRADRECQKIIESGIHAVNLNILDGEDASLGEFPHMVALGFDRGNGYTFDCGGSVISNNYVLTAAHCVDNIQGIEPSVVRTGVVELGGDQWDSETDVGIAEIIKHPKYTRSKQYHDMALLRLNKTLEFSTSLNAVCLDTSGNDPSNTEPLYITGWGQTSNTKDARSTLLLKATVKAVSTDKCAESYTFWRKLPQGIIDNQLCAGDPKGKKDTCQGDSGGPLQSMDDNSIYRVVGITSFGRGCGSPVPGVYTRVAKYVDWIEGVVWPQ